jgi:signal transduction histidine kinase
LNLSNPEGVSSTFLSANDEERSSFLERAVHDLRAASRGIALAAELGIGTVTESLERLNSILDGVSRYMLAVRYAEYALEPYSTDHALTAAMQPLHQILEQSAARVLRSNLPIVHGDPRWIRELFGILILNSITYRSAEPPEISFSARADGEFWLFSVADNGIGVEPKYSQQIFAPFRRLHGSSLPGTGLGLSIADKIVKGHGGTIWLGETPGAGATMQFRLPQLQTAL